MHAPAWRSGTAPLRPSEGKPLGAPQKGFHRPLFTRGGDGSGLSDLNMELKQGGSVQFTVASSPIASPDGRTRMTTSPLRSGERVGGRRFEFPTPEPLPIVTNSSSGTAPTVVNMSWSAVSGEGTQVGLPQPKQSPEDAKWRGNRPSASPVGTPGHTNGGLPELPVRGGQSPIFPLPGGSPLSPQAILTLQQYCVGSPEEGWEGDGCGRPASNRDVVGKAGRSQLGASFAARPPGSALQRKSMDTSSTEPIVTSHRGIVAPHRKQKQVIASHQLRSGGNTDTPDMAALSITGFNPIHHQNSGSTEGGSVQERPPARQKGAFPQDLQGNLTSHQRQPITVLAPNPSKDNTGSGALTDRSPRDVKKLTKSLSAGARPPTRAKPLSEALYLDDVDGENPSSRQPKISDIRVTGQSEDAGNVKVTLTGTGKPLLPPQLQFTGRVDGDNDIGISPIKRMDAPFVRSGGWVITDNTESVVTPVVFVPAVTTSIPSSATVTTTTTTTTTQNGSTAPLTARQHKPKLQPTQSTGKDRPFSAKGLVRPSHPTEHSRRPQHSDTHTGLSQFETSLDPEFLNLFARS